MKAKTLGQLSACAFNRWSITQPSIVNVDRGAAGSYSGGFFISRLTSHIGAPAFISVE